MMADESNDLAEFVSELLTEDGDCTLTVNLPNPLAGLVADDLVLTVNRDAIKRRKNGSVVVTFEATLFGVFLCDVTMKADLPANRVTWRVLA